MENKEITYSLKRSGRSRRLRIAVYFDSRVVVTAPLSLSQNMIERFVADKQAWIVRRLLQFAKRPRHLLEFAGTYRDHREDAFRLAQSKVAEWNTIYGFSFNVIHIRNQKTRWGSCSRKGNLNFNYKIKFLPSRFTDYLVVHELCHLKEFNHSKKFWDMVAIALPDYKNLRAEFRQVV